MAKSQNQFLVDWAKLGVRDEPLWSYECKASMGVAVCKNAVLVAEESKIVALKMEDGGVLWLHPLPASAVEWGLAVDSHGRAIVTLKDGRVLCFGPLG